MCTPYYHAIRYACKAEWQVSWLLEQFRLDNRMAGSLLNDLRFYVVQLDNFSSSDLSLVFIAIFLILYSSQL